MDGVGVGGSTRLGSRSSTRHGPASVFQGPVRKWRKSWTPIQTTSANHASSRVLLYKWSPISGNKDDPTEENSPQKTRYIPVYVVIAKQMEELAKKQAEAAAQADTESRDLNMEFTTPDSRGSKQPDEEVANESSQEPRLPVLLVDSGEGTASGDNSQNDFKDFKREKIEQDASEMNDQTMEDASQDDGDPANDDAATPSH